MQLRVSENKRYLEYEDGAPFFYLGDTAWELFHSLSRDEAALYLENRAAKGFTVVQAVVLTAHDGPDAPSASGARALIDNDPAQPNPAYFRHVDAIVEKAASLGLFIGMLPTWGNKWQSRGGDEPPIFNVENARIYGRFLGARYHDRPIIWILGGDHNIESERDYRVIESMAAGLREGDEGRHLITYHPRGPGRSSDYFQDAPWLDFNMFQSSHAAHDFDNGVFVDHDYQLDPPKPTLDGEPRYETIVVGFYNAGVGRYDRFDAYDVRQAAYWSLLAGACGHTYGNNSIWQMWRPGRKPAIEACVPWIVALDHPGAFQMGLVRGLFESRLWSKLVPDQAMVVDGPQTGGGKIRAARAVDGSFAFCYSPRGEPFTVCMDVIRSLAVRETWYDPRYGISSFIHSGRTTGVKTYVPPTRGRGCDWVLVLDAVQEGGG